MPSGLVGPSVLLAPMPSGLVGPSVLLAPMPSGLVGPSVLLAPDALRARRPFGSPRADARVGEAGRHPWELARARFFRRLIARSIDVSAVRRVLDVGAGDGWFAQELLPDLGPTAEVVCWDVNYRSEDLATPAGPASRGRASGRTAPSTSSSCWTSWSTWRTTRASWPERWCR